ncbi:MAG: TerC family protein [Candidatus Rokubacteria bacterium]|nr:TerC family protein [Candidatus Rokubacteria bacterium]
MDALLSADNLVALLTLSALEIVLGIDNIVFIAILTSRLPADQQPRARKTGLVLALGIRIGLLFAIAWIMSLTRPFFGLLGHDFSGRDLILLGGGLFLIAKATWEIYDKLEVEHHEEHAAGGGRSGMASVIVQILLLDIVFSLDSVITAIGMANHVPVMIAAMVIAMVVMLFSMSAISGFIERHPSLKILALSFLLLIGVMLVAEGMGAHIPKGYIYVAMAFSLGVELLNMQFRRKQRAVVLHRRFEDRAA